MMNEYGTDLFMHNITSMRDCLHFAVARGDYDRTKRYVSAGANLNEVKFWHTPLQLSLTLGHDTISKFLLNQPQVQLRDFITTLPWSYLSAIVERSSMEVIKMLFETFDISREKYNLFIKAACNANHVELIRYFIANPKLRWYLVRYDMLYEIVCGKDSFEVLELLVENNIRVITGTGKEWWLNRPYQPRLLILS